MPGRLIQDFARVAGRLRNRPDTEHVQALIRVILVIFIAAYLNSTAADNLTTSALWIDRTAIGYAMVSIGFVCWIIANPKISYFRRYLAMVMEHSLLSACLILEGERAAPLFLIYVWVSLGNGFRYGVTSLLWSTAVSTAGFCAVIVFSEFFRSILPVSVGMLLTLIAIPLYSASLIRQLQTAKSNAEQANRAKSRFLATASHELRTPLHSIISLSDLLQSTPLTADQAEMIRTVRNSGDSLLHLVEDVLDISSIEAGRLVSYQTDFDLYLSLAETVAIVRPQALAKGLEIGLYIAPDTPGELTADWKHIGQILLNLLTNAIKFTHHGHVMVEVSPSPVTGSGLRFVVSDTGIGMDAKTIPRIFDTFVQSDETATRSYGGVGLGLAIVRQVVTLLNGTIEVASEVGAGSRFTVDVPVICRNTPVIMPRHRAVLYSRDQLLATVLARLCPDLEVLGNPQSMPGGYDGPTVAFVDLRDGMIDSADVQAATATIQCSLVAIPRSDAAMDRLCVTSLTMGSAADIIEPVLRIATATAFRRQLAPAAEAEAIRVPEDTEPQPGFSAVTVLVVDDSAVNRMVTDKVLRSGGFEAVLAADAEAALDILAERDFDLLLLDINMPGHSGIDVIKTYGFMRMGLSMPPIVVFSAEVTPETRRECAELGVNLFLPKPSEPKVILTSLRAVLDAAAQVLPVGGPPVHELELADNEAAAASLPRRFPIFDRRVIAGLRELSGDSDFLSGLLTEFAEDAETVLGSIDRAVHQRNLPEFWDQVHALRSSAGNVGAFQILSQCSAAMAAGRASFLIQGSVYATSLRQEYTRFTRALTRLDSPTAVKREPVPYLRERVDSNG